MKPDEKNKPPVIWFSNYYSKFKKIRHHEDLILPVKARLLQCLKVHHKDLNRWFVDYDAHIPDSNTYYPIPETELIVLLFEVSFNRIITTIRRYTPQKWEYYKGLEGEFIEFRHGK